MRGRPRRPRFLWAPRVKIVYYVESTRLYGGTKVIFRQAEALASRGHRVVVVSPEEAPDWFHGSVEFFRGGVEDLALMEEADCFVGTYYLHLQRMFAYPSIRPRMWHLSQGYEGGWPEAEPFMDAIEAAYRLPVPRMVISKELKQRLSSRFPGFYCSVGQGVEHQYFYPPSHLDNGFRTAPRVFLFGTYPASVKNVEKALVALRLARKRAKHPFELVRITTTDTRGEEEALYGPIDGYHVSVEPRQVGEILRKGGVMLCPNRPGEGFGLPAVEAMASGVPTVLSAIPSHLSFARRKNYAIFVDPEDPGSMADGVVRLLEDHHLRLRLMHRGLQVARRFRFSRVARRIEWCLRLGALRRMLRVG